MMGLENRCCQKELLHIAFHTFAIKEMSAGRKGSYPGMPRTTSSPTGTTLGFGSLTWLKKQSNSAYPVN